MGGMIQAVGKKKAVSNQMASFPSITGNFFHGARPNSRRPGYIVLANQLAKRLTTKALQGPIKDSAKMVKRVWQETNKPNKDGLIAVLNANNVLHPDGERYIRQANGRTFQAFVTSLRTNLEPVNHAFVRNQQPQQAFVHNLHTRRNNRS